MSLARDCGSGVISWSDIGLGDRHCLDRDDAGLGVLWDANGSMSVTERYMIPYAKLEE